MLGLADESQLSDSSSVTSAQYQEGPSLPVEACSTRSNSGCTDGIFHSIRDSKLATAVPAYGDNGRAESARMSRFPYRLLGVNPFGEEEKGFSNSEEMLRDLLDEVMR